MSFTLRFSVWMVIVLSLGHYNVYCQDDFRCFVVDRFQDKAIDYAVSQDCVVYGQHGPKETSGLQYNSVFSLTGCRKKSFIYQDQFYSGQIDANGYKEFYALLSKLNLNELRIFGSTSCLTGWLVINGQEKDFDNPLGNPCRDRLQDLVVSFVDRMAPKGMRKVTRHSTEGDFEPPRDVTIPELLRSPANYDGKRIRVAGHYSVGLEQSSLSVKIRDGIQRSIWIGGISSFANEADIDSFQGGTATIEGTFSGRAGGHLGLWPGEIERVTKFSLLAPPLTPKPPYSSKRGA